mgnify:CR=1 FL=1
MPSARNRSTMRLRVRVDVMPIPDIFSAERPHRAPSLILVRLMCASHAPTRCHLVVVRKVDLQRRHRRVALLDRVEVGAFARIRGGAGGADPVDGLAARILTVLTTFSALCRRPEPRDRGSP